MKEFVLNNGILGAYKRAKDTPRVAVALNVAINKPEKIPGTYSLMNRLLLQGTKTRSSEQLAKILDENAIDLHTDMKQDYLRFKFVCLNEDINLAFELFEDIIKNSTFEEFEKEVNKMRGEIVAELDSARTKAIDAFAKTIYEGHYYGNSYSVVLENLDKIKKEEVIEAFNEIMNTGTKVVGVAGDIDFEKIQSLFNDSIGEINNTTSTENTINSPSLNEKKFVTVVKEDAQQAQIIQGWIVPTLYSEDYPALVLINTILGASGLSSRLFLELREKKGLAYHVRSSCEARQACGTFSIYIATEPKNIKVALDGFTAEIDKIKSILVSEKELEDAKNNIIGKQAFVSETNSQKVNIMTNYAIMGLGFDFHNSLIDKIRKVTSEDILRVANKYFNENFATVVLNHKEI